MKKLTFLFFLLTMSLFCSSAYANQDAFQWQIEIEAAKVATSLDSTSTITEYGGTESQVANNNQSADGNVYLLLHVDLHKSKTGGKGFDWKTVSLIDEAGNSYTRMKNDTFLRTHGYDRLQSTKIMLSSNGWICFEIPESTLSKKLYFVHSSEQGENKVLIEKQ